MQPTQLLFVCLGNICRSPTAEGIMLSLLEREGLQHAFVCDSAGTSGWHEGERADARMRQHAKQRGYELPSRSRKFIAKDFEIFDYIVVMDESNYENVAQLDPNKQYREKIVRMTQFCRQHDVQEVPDPYYGGADGFEEVMDILEDACEGFLAHLHRT